MKKNQYATLRQTQILITALMVLSIMVDFYNAYINKNMMIISGNTKTLLLIILLIFPEPLDESLIRYGSMEYSFEKRKGYIMMFIRATIVFDILFGFLRNFI